MGMRLSKEAKTVNATDGMTLEIVNEHQNVWHVTFTMAEGTVYAGETYTLRFRFIGNYPFEAPEVVFVGTPPKHVHVYSNGFICLSTLSKDWTPALQTSTVTMSIMSMLANAQVKESPPNDASSVAYMNRMGSPKKVQWEFDDDKC